LKSFGVEIVLVGMGQWEEARNHTSFTACEAARREVDLGLGDWHRQGSDIVVSRCSVVDIVKEQILLTGSYHGCCSAGSVF
jgi:hypothetical protein